MKFKKLGLIIIIFLALLGIGSMLSNVQSREADQLLEAYGLSNSTRYIEVNQKQKVSTFLHYLTKNYPHNNIQVHLAKKGHSSQTLIWANHTIINLPTESGRYFSTDDFQGQVSFAVLGLNAKVKTLKTQGNQYVILGQKYYSVIGILKHYRQMKQDGYYLTTGPQQPTGRFKLKNYQIIIDASDKVMHKIAMHYHVKEKTPLFVKKHQIHQFSVIREILLIILFLIAAISCNFLLAVVDWQTVKRTNLSGNLLRNWLINRGIRIILTEILVTVGAYLFLRWRAFYSKPEHLIWLLAASWLVIVIGYTCSIVYLSRKDKNCA
ncbi:hypothetical protein OZY43_04320 [Lactobacillus sp. ESL0785]|uniref:hypothetical protein n=1 Tax=Lactobacillus sp. ESL0785 TaxID=2983232 RepID=UPI0023FA1B6B|nr:hypothetical protein [Lactobacillus sp. ESL0785]WEV70187.1 hypothetical protein OZY43_04320 [Lactobacillus sp. ESL0785]